MISCYKGRKCMMCHFSEISVYSNERLDTNATTRLADAINGIAGEKKLV